MVSDVFIGYDAKDEDIAQDICNLLENNNKKCWFKKRDYGENDTVDKISEAIRSSGCFLLIHSKNSKESNFVTTDMDIAFSSDVPILIFAIDDSTIEGKQQLYLKDKPKIDAYPKTEDYYDELLDDVSQMSDSSENKSLSQNEAYICYADEDVLTAEAICHALEENGIRCWFKKRDLSVKDTNEKIIDVIKNSKSFILVFSEDANSSNFVKTETNFALSSNIPILSFKIDETKKTDDLKDAHWLDAYPNSGDHFRELVVDTSKLINRPIDNPKISEPYKGIEKSSKKEQVKPEVKLEKPSKDMNMDDSLGKRFKTILVIVIIVGVLALIGYYISTFGLTFLDERQEVVVTGDGNVSIGDKPQAPTIELVLSSMKSNNNHYTISYRIFDEPENFSEYTIHTAYLDGSGNKIEETTTKMKDIARNGTDLILVDHTCKEKPAVIENTITDENNNHAFHDKVKL